MDMPREDSQFKHGNKGGKGGRRENSGRPPDWLREVCDAELDKRKIAQLRAKIAAGEPIVTKYKDESGKWKEIVRIPSLRDMQDAGDWLADRGQGKAPQTIKTPDAVGIDFITLLHQAEDERGIPRTQ